MVMVPRRKEVSDAEIREAARKVFLERGTQAPVTEVAKELGVSAATLFNRMGSKENLIVRALWPPDPPVLEALDAGVRPDVPIASQLLEIVAAIAAYVAEEIPATFTLYAAGARPNPSEQQEVTPFRLRRRLAKFLAQAAAAGAIRCDKPEVAADTIIGTMEARHLHAFLARRTISPRKSRYFARDLLRTVFGDDAVPPPRSSADSV